MSEPNPRRELFGGRLEVVRCDVWAVTRDALTLPVEGLPEGMTLEEVTSSDHPILELLSEQRRGFARRTLDAGDHAWFLLENGKPVAWWWTSVRSHTDPVAGMRVSLLPGEIYLYDIWTVKEHRRSGAAIHLATWVLRGIAEAGQIERCLTYIDRDNDASRPLARQFNFEPVQQFLSIRRGQRGWQIPGTARPRGDAASRFRRPPSA